MEKCDDIWIYVTELERAAWSRSYSAVQRARGALENFVGVKRPEANLESASQFRRTVIQKGLKEGE